ncbi:TrkA family potassium uptake protein, partial [Pauljensenia sp. UMB3104]|uniref:NAD-binding protein n=1 Tax=Pauljensenia sp. UMB3104 TaxID=3046331 RepID=UPI0030156BB5|nr:TrkA family potassium uptake protein [Pauljensenia sp. UMB3104]
VYPDLDAGKRTAHLVGGRMVDYIEMEKDGFLEQLGAREFRSAVVGVGSSLEAAVLITANLVDMGISSIWVKATSSQHGRILRRVGAHH